MLASLKRYWLIFNYKWAMVNAYLTQDYAPAFCSQWLNDADRWYLELWRFDSRLK